MDILTHLFAGAAIASTWRGRPPPDPLGFFSRGARAAAALREVAASDPTARVTPATPPITHYGSRLVCALIGSFAPDLDVLVNPYGEEGEGLAYMLLHRGFTHTLLGGAVLAALLAGLACLTYRVQRRAAFTELLRISALAVLLHVGMDYTNDYGVHPFSPLYDGWFYGDFIFLVEPLLWFALLPLAIGPLFRDKGSRLLNLAVAAVLVGLTLGLPGFVWVRVAQDEWMTLLPAAVLTLWWAAQLLAYGRWTSPWLGWGSVAAVWAVFFSMSRVAKSEATQLLQQHAPEEQLVDVATTPAPSNPLCFRVVTASFQPDAEEIRTRVGTYSLWPSLVSPARCFTAARSAPPNARLEPSDLADGPGWYWLGIFRGKKATFDEYAQSCSRVAMTKSFLRAPFWAEQGEGRIVIGDLRLDYAQDLTKYCKLLYRTDQPDSCGGPEVAWQQPYFSSLALRGRARGTSVGLQLPAAD